MRGEEWKGRKGRGVEWVQSREEERREREGRAEGWSG